MAKKRAAEPKRRRKSSATSLKRTLEAAITSNPFLNFFLSKCRVKGNAKLHKFARRAGDQWKDMSYQEKTPYYLLADKARTTTKKKSKKRRFSESDIGEGSFSMITVIKKPDSIKKDSTEELGNKTDYHTDKEEPEKKEDKREEQQNQEGTNEGTSKIPNSPSVQNSVRNEENASKKHVHHLKSHKRKKSASSTGSTSFHSMDSDDSVERDSKRRGKKCRSWTDSFDYMS